MESRPPVQSNALTQSANVIEMLTGLIEQARQNLQLDEIAGLTSASQRIVELSQQLGTTLTLHSCAAVVPKASNSCRSEKVKFEPTGHKPCLELIPHTLYRSEVSLTNLNLFPAEPDVVYKPKAKLVHRGCEPLAFEMLEQNLGSEASLEILNVYVRSTAELVVEIQEGIRKQSHETVSAALNELNSSCTVVGASGVVQQCTRMLQYLQKPDWKRLDGSMAELVRETRTVGQYVSELLSKPAGGHI